MIIQILDREVTVVTLEGEHFHAQAAFHFKQEVIDTLLKNNINYLIINFVKVQSIDIKTASTFLFILRLVHEKGGRLALVSLNRSLRTTFELLSLHKMIPLFNSLQEALELP